MNKLFYKLFFISFIWLSNSFAISFEKFLQGPVRTYMDIARSVSRPDKIYIDKKCKKYQEKILNDFVGLHNVERQRFLNYLTPQSIPHTIADQEFSEIRAILYQQNYETDPWLQVANIALLEYLLEKTNFLSESDYISD
ncbi:hypothetical protein P618_200725 [Holospora obtusa F1]|uniref:Uncharacterized protein n=1 Tax=Holospora obtusa F1 TaxID=1399147 RepID=W6TTI5_HOLOB|nr:hypothetical protein [Holospora obtusa]ETZ07097.1 hypothetical protein P618_200725 [Holospora obtusa F1]